MGFPVRYPGPETDHGVGVLLLGSGGDDSRHEPELRHAARHEVRQWISVSIADI